MNFEETINDAIKTQEFDGAKTIFAHVAGKLFDHFYSKFVDIDKDEAVEECVKICLGGLDRFPEEYKFERTKSFNYFTTIMLCHLRQLYRKTGRKPHPYKYDFVGFKKELTDIGLIQ